MATNANPVEPTEARKRKKLAGPPKNFWGPASKSDNSDDRPDKKRKTGEGKDEEPPASASAAANSDSKDAKMETERSS
jgi:hypothetical protein